VSAPHLAAGQVVADKYSIRAMLGYGGATATYAAVLPPGREVVIKVFSLQLSQRGDVLGVLQQVAAVTNGLADSTAPVLESGFDTQTGVPFMVTDLIALPSLAQAVLHGGPLAPAEVVLLVRGTARSVDAAHAQRLAHGAIKPQNVFVGAAPHRVVRVVDFGVAVARAALHTNEGFAVAAPWMAPEQMQGTPGGAAADIFSTALMAFFAATGRSYWLSCQGPVPNLSAWQREIVGPRTPPSVRARELGVTLVPALDSALSRALSLNPAERFASLGELADAMIQGGAAAPPRMAMAMTMPLGAMPQAAQDLLRQQVAAAAAAEPSYGGETTLSVHAPVDPSWPLGPPAQYAPPAQQAFPVHSAPPPRYSQGPASGSVVVLPRSRTGLVVALALVALLVVGAGVAAVRVVQRRAAVVAIDPLARPSPTQPAAASALPAPEEPTPAVAVPAPVETQSAAPLAEAVPDASAPAAEGPDGGAAAQAELVILCTPNCDSVKVDDRMLDTNDAGVVSPDPVEVAVGTHTVTVGRATYVSQTKRVTLKTRQRARETFYLFRPGAVPPLPRPCGKFLERCPN
jgi:hypothetical protein